MDVIGVMAAYLPVVTVCVLHSLERHCVCTVQSREACWSNLKDFKIFYNNSNCNYELHICASVG